MSLATELHDILQAHGHLEYTSMKVASDEVTEQGQMHVAKIANAIADLVLQPTSNQTVTFVEKLAADLGKELDSAARLKIATAVVVDRALTKSAQDTALPACDRTELLNTRTYGREVFTEILRGIL